MIETAYGMFLLSDFIIGLGLAALVFLAIFVIGHTLERIIFKKHLTGYRALAIRNYRRSRF